MAELIVRAGWCCRGCADSEAPPGCECAPFEKPEDRVPVIELVLNEFWMPDLRPGGDMNNDDDWEMVPDSDGYWRL